MIPTKTKSLAKFPGPGRFHFNFPQKATFYAVSSQTMLKDRKMRKSYRMLRFGTQKAVKKINELWHTKDEYSGFIWAPDDSWYGRISSDKKKVLFFEPSAAEKVVNTIVSADGAPIQAFAA